jgi:NAD(P)-dependent dehydrogenase (short-subunit alcohol dehydrogenase family)
VARWTEGDIPDQSGRVAVVTGANSGIGWDTARALAEHGARVVLVCRNPDRAADAVSRIRASAPDAALEVQLADLADLDQVRAVAHRIMGAHDRVDLLVNNAGLMATPPGTTPQGFELQLGVNHLAPFALTGLLLERLLATPGSRVVAVSSQGHRAGRIRFDDLDFTRGYHPWRAYFQSKLANLLFTRELQRRLEEAGVLTIAVAAHPGGSATNLGHDNPGGLLNDLGAWARPVIERAVMQPSHMGALPTLRAATDPGVRGGEYFGPDGLFQQRGHPTRVGCTARARNDADAARLWAVSVQRTGVDYAALDAG